MIENLPLLFLSNFCWQSGQWLAACAAFRHPVKLKEVLLANGAMGALIVLSLLDIVQRDSPYALFILWGHLLLLLIFVMRIRGWKIITSLLIVHGLNLLEDIVGVSALVGIMGQEFFFLERESFTVKYGIVSSVANIFAWLVVAGGVLAVHRAHSCLKEKVAGYRILRLVFACGLLLVYALSSTRLLNEITVTRQTGLYAANYILSLLMTTFILTFIAQDIRFLQQSRHNETLRQKQQAIDELLLGMRSFRHNIANLLYGMEGAMLSKDFDETQAYYDQLVEKCRLINTENILALQQIPLKALSALLLRKLNDAYEARIPFYLYVEPRLGLRGLSKTDLCEIAGVLLDNALEAAAKSKAPYVSVELRSAQRGTEMIIRNTFSQAVCAQSLFISSTKEGHEGLGLHSVMRALERYPNAMMNLRIAGRYVEAQVLAY